MSDKKRLFKANIRSGQYDHCGVDVFVVATNYAEAEKMLWNDDNKHWKWGTMRRVHSIENLGHRVLVN